MKIISRTLTVLTMAFLLACSNDESVNVTQQNLEQGEINEGLTQGYQEEYNILEVENDPDFVMENPGTENKMYKVAAPGKVEVAQIRTYLAKDKNAKGRVYYELYRGPNELIARSGSFDVQKLATYSSSTLRYTSLYWNVNIPVDVNYAYILKVTCSDCEQSGENINVYWWQSNSENDNMFRMVSKTETENGSTYWVPTDQNDFTFNVTVRRDDKTTYNNQSNFKRKIATPINLGFEYGQSFTPSFEFPCEPLSQLIVSEIEVNDVEEDSSGNNKKLTFSLVNTSNNKALLSDIYTIYTLQTTNEWDNRGEWHLFAYRASVADLSEDEEVKNTRVMPPNTTTQFSTLFNSEPNDTQYKYIGFDIQVVDENNEKWCDEPNFIYTELEEEK